MKAKRVSVYSSFTPTKDSKTSVNLELFYTGTTILGELKFLFKYFYGNYFNQKPPYMISHKQPKQYIGGAYERIYSECMGRKNTFFFFVLINLNIPWSNFSKTAKNHPRLTWNTINNRVSSLVNVFVLIFCCTEANAKQQKLNII